MPWGWGKLAGFAALPLFGLAAAGATPWAVDHIEDQLTDNAYADLAEIGVGPGEVDIDFDYRDGLATLRALPAGMTIEGVADAVDHGLVNDFEVQVTGDGVEAAVPATAPVRLDASGDADGIVLEGTVSRETERQQLLDQAAALVGADNVEDRLTVDDSLDPSLTGPAVNGFATAIAALDGADTWTANLDGTDLTIDATTADPTIGDRIGALEDDANLNVTTTVAAPAAAAPSDAELIETEITQLQAELDALAVELRQNVVFATASDQLSPAATTTLDKVVAAMGRYQLPVVMVTGHTDSQGNPAANQELSTRRAASVAAYLGTGTPPERLQSRGAGDTQPIAPNETSEGRAQNRRVELTALASF